MGRRGRTSAAALRLVAAQHDSDRRRPPAPGDLTPEQAAEWDAIVAGMPKDWFRRENYALLAEYCRCVVDLRRLNGILDRLKQVDEGYERVFGLIERRSKLLMSLATKMRLSQHATYDKKKSKGPTITAPWED